MSTRRKGPSATQNKKAGAPKRKVGRYVVLGVCVVALGWYGTQFNWQQWLPELDWRIDIDDEIEITSVIVEGRFEYSDKSAVQDLLAEMLQHDFVRLDLRQIQQVLLGNPWFRQVSVSRVWPSSLKVEIEEQQPIALWGDDAFINRYGDIIRVKDLARLRHLPALHGQDSEAYDIASEYLTMARLLSDQQLFVSALKVSDSGQWQLEVDRQFTVELGDRERSQRLERFRFLYQQQLAGFKSDLEKVDMRYANGVAVKWKGASAQWAAAVKNKEMAGR